MRKNSRNENAARLASARHADGSPEKRSIRSTCGHGTLPWQRSLCGCWSAHRCPAHGALSAGLDDFVDANDEIEAIAMTGMTERGSFLDDILAARGLNGSYIGYGDPAPGVRRRCYLSCRRFAHTIARARTQAQQSAKLGAFSCVNGSVGDFRQEMLSFRLDALADALSDLPRAAKARMSPLRELNGPTAARFPTAG